jgi:hypothetical protein
VSECTAEERAFLDAWLLDGDHRVRSKAIGEASRALRLSRLTPGAIADAKATWLACRRADRAFYPKFRAVQDGLGEEEAQALEQSWRDEEAARDGV